MPFIRTMQGDIAPENLGFTYAHEHIVCRPPHWVERGESDLLLDDPEKSCQEVALFREAGGQSIVDATAIDYGRDPEAVCAIAQKTGVQIIGTAGFNKGFLWDAKMPGQERTFADWIDSESEDRLAQFVIDEVEQGMWGIGAAYDDVHPTKVRAGQVKFGTGYNSMTPLEIKTIRAACRAHLQTGAPVHSHTEAGTMALEQMRIIREEGVDLSCVSFGHMDRNPDPWMHRRVAETGAFLCFDGIAKVKYNPESVRIRCILDLVKAGHQKQILISGDTARRSYYSTYTHAVGLPYIITTWIPRLMEQAEEEGIDGGQLVEDLFINNPRACMTFRKG